MIFSNGLSFVLSKYWVRNVTGIIGKLNFSFHIPPKNCFANQRFEPMTLQIENYSEILHLGSRRQIWYSRYNKKVKYQRTQTTYYVLELKNRSILCILFISNQKSLMKSNLVITNSLGPCNYLCYNCEFAITMNILIAK